MTVRHLKIFIAVADTGKMSLAAKALFISQPTVSAAVAEIESYYGTLLFERLNKRLYITQTGRELLSYARHIVALFEEMELHMHNAANCVRLRVGATITVGSCVLADVVERFESAFPGAKITVRVDNTRACENLVLQGEADLALVEGTVHHPDLTVTPFLEDELVLVCGPSHPFAGRESVCAADLEGQAFILREEGSGTRQLFEEYLERCGVRIEEKWICQTPEAIVSAVAHGQGLSVLSKLLVREKGLCILRLRDMRFLRMFSIIYHKNKYLSPPLDKFIELTKDRGELRDKALQGGQLPL